jgi:hypothetical protein
MQETWDYDTSDYGCDRRSNDDRVSFRVVTGPVPLDPATGHFNADQFVRGVPTTQISLAEVVFSQCACDLFLQFGLGIGFLKY